MLDDDRTPEGRFRPGQSGNPAGRPRGSRNKATVFLEGLLDGQAETLIQRLVSEAVRGNMVALRMCFDRLEPRRRGRPVELALPRLESKADAVDAVAAIAAGITVGELTPAEAADLIKLVDAFVRVRAATDLERRVADLERPRSGAPAKSEPANAGESAGDAAATGAGGSVRAAPPHPPSEPGGPADAGESAVG